MREFTRAADSHLVSVDAYFMNVGFRLFGSSPDSFRHGYRRATSLCREAFGFGLNLGIFSKNYVLPKGSLWRELSSVARLKEFGNDCTF